MELRYARKIVCKSQKLTKKGSKSAFLTGFSFFQTNKTGNILLHFPLFLNGFVCFLHIPEFFFSSLTIRLIHVL